MPWQQDTWQQFNATLSEGRFPHALLVTGSQGIGKAHLSRALAALLLCHDPVAGTACDRCRGCELRRAGSHGDFMHLGLEEKSRQIKVDQVRALSDFLAKTATLGRNKVVLINPADAMNLNASNALLKSLEEPASNTYLILVATSMGKVAPTIRSRCQQLNLPDPLQEDAAAWLEAACGSKPAADELLDLTRGKPVAALDLFNEDGLAREKTLASGLEALADGRISPVEFPQIVAEESLEAVLSRLADFLEQRLRDSILAGGSDLRVTFELLDDLRLMARRVESGGNPNRQLSIETAAMQFQRALGRSA